MNLQHRVKKVESAVGVEDFNIRIFYVDGDEITHKGKKYTRQEVDEMRTQPCIIVEYTKPALCAEKEVSLLDEEFTGQD